MLNEIRDRLAELRKKKAQLEDELLRIDGAIRALEEMEKLAAIEEGATPTPIRSAEVDSFAVSAEPGPEPFALAAGRKPINDVTVEAEMRLVLEGKHRKSNAITISTLRNRVCKGFEPPSLDVIDEGLVATAIDNVFAKSRNGPFRIRESDDRVYYEE